MKHEELVNMTPKDLRARLKEINQHATDAAGEALDTLITCLLYTSDAAEDLPRQQAQKNQRTTEKATK